jgi:hypothetical protein
MLFLEMILGGREEVTWSETITIQFLAKNSWTKAL